MPTKKLLTLIPTAKKPERAIVGEALISITIVVTFVNIAVFYTQINAKALIQSPTTTYSALKEGGGIDSVRRRAVQNPEVQEILRDPAMQLILQQMEKDPSALRE